MKFEKETGLTNKLNPDNNEDIVKDVRKKELPRGQKPEDIEDSNEETIIDPGKSEAAKFLSKREMVENICKEVGFDEKEKVIGEKLYIPKDNSGGEIITDHIDRMISTFKREEEGDEMVPPEMKELSDFIPTIDGGIKSENIITKSPNKKGKFGNNKVYSL